MFVMSKANEKLAIQGGSKAVTIGDPEQWKQIREEEIKLVTEMLSRGEVSVGGAGVAKQFEDEFRDFIGTKYCLSQCNGTSTLWSAYFAVGVGPGDEVIHPSYTWMCSIAPAVYLGARPVFCEIDPETLVADPRDIEKRITPRTRAISVVHIWGNVVDMEPIMEISKKYGIPVIEDCSHAHGAEYDGKKVGSIGDIGCFSLQGSKPMIAGEGGLVVTSNKDYYERMLIFGHLNRAGMENELEKPEHKELAPLGLGVKFRSHPLAMGIAKVQFSRLGEINRRREAIIKRMNNAFEEIPGLQPLKVYPKAKPGGFYGFRVLYKPEELGGLPREKFVEALQAEGANVGPCRYPLHHLLPLFAKGFDFYTGNRGPLSGDYKGYKRGDLPVTEELHERLLALPVFTDPKEGVVDQYIKAFKKVAENYKSIL